MGVQRLLQQLRTYLPLSHHTAPAPRETLTGPCGWSPLSGKSPLQPHSTTVFHLRVVCVYGLSPGSPALDGLHGRGVKRLLPHGTLLIRRAVGSFGLALPFLLVYVMNPKQEAVVHDFKTFQHLQVSIEFKNKDKMSGQQLSYSTDPNAWNSPSAFPPTAPSNPSEPSRLWT